jgi:hypothetical protein
MENMQIQNNLIDTALQSGVEVYIFWKFLHLSISATTAKEEYLWILWNRLTNGMLLQNNRCESLSSHQKTIQ